MPYRKKKKSQVMCYKEREGPHMEEVGVVDGSNQRKTFTQETGVGVHLKPKVNVGLF